MSPSFGFEVILVQVAKFEDSESKSKLVSFALATRRHVAWFALGFAIGTSSSATVESTVEVVLDVE